MSLVLLESFDDGFAPERHSTLSGHTISSTYGRHGNGLYLPNGAQIATNVGLGTALSTEGWVGFAARPASSGSIDGMFFVFNGAEVYSPSTSNFSMRASGTSLLIYSGGAALRDTIANAFTVNEWAYWEVYVKYHTSTGAYEVRKNGTNISSSASVDTHGSTAGLEWISMEGGTNHLFSIDDIYVDDAGFKGDMRIDGLDPSAAGTYTQLTPLSGSNYANVNEASQDGDTSYVEHATDGNKDTYAYDNIPVSPGTIHGISIATYAKKTDTAVKSFRRVLRSGSTDYTGSDVTLGTGYALTEEVLETDPNTASAWTESGVNAMEVGVEVRP